jgi:biopolymer transport protein ExbD
MKFARNAKIFRGPLDPAPVAGVFFLLLIFLMLGSLLYTPGVLIQIPSTSSVNGPVVAVARDGAVTFAGKTYKETELGLLRADLKSVPGTQTVALQTDPGAPQRVVDEIRNLFQIELPGADNLSGTDDPKVVVAVNFRGQFFCENQIMQAADLKAQLRKSLQAALRDSKDLTMVLLADKSVENQVVMRLGLLAGEVGIKHVLVAQRPSVFSKPGEVLP